MSGFKDHFSDHADRYAQARPTYPPELFTYLASLSPGRQLAWDCATGNGQAAVGLVAHFERVIATDASAAQLAHASPHPRIEYRAATGEEADLAAGSADLVTIAQALHWLRLPDLYSNVRRVLRPGGIFAAWCYAENRISPAVDALTRRLDDEIVKAYWPEGRCWIDDHYQSIPFPEGEIKGVPSFDCCVTWTLGQYMAYVDSWSAVQRFRQQRGADPLALIAKEMAAAWGDADQPRAVCWPLYLRVARM